jgi:hypothetical protein
MLRFWTISRFVETSISNPVGPAILEGVGHRPRYPRRIRIDFKRPLLLVASPVEANALARPNQYSAICGFKVTAEFSGGKVLKRIIRHAAQIQRRPATAGLRISPK